MDNLEKFFTQGCDLEKEDGEFYCDKCGNKAKKNIHQSYTVVSCCDNFGTYNH